MRIFSSSIFLALGAAVGLSAPAFASHPGDGGPWTTPAPIAERLLGLVVGDQGVTFQVESGGCTNKGSFSLVVQESFPPQLTLMRDNPDFCKAFLPYGVALTFSYEELGVPPGTEFEITNALVGRYRNHAEVPACRPSGCSGQVCSEEDVVTTCDWREEYACYQDGAECARQEDGACGWTPTPELALCLSAARR